MNGVFVRARISWYRNILYGKLLWVWYQFWNYIFSTFRISVYCNDIQTKYIYIREYVYFYFKLIVFIALMHTCLFKFPVRFILRYVFDKLNWKGETLNMDLFFSDCLISTSKFCSTQYKRLARFKQLLCMAKYHKNISYQCSKIRLNSINKIRQLFAT